MPRPSLYLFDDRIARSWEPFALTRPAGELLFGVMTLRGRAEHALDLTCAGHLAADHLIGFDEAGAPPVVTPAEVPTDRPRLFLLSRFVPEPVSRVDWGTVPAGPVVSRFGDIVGWFSPAGTPSPDEQFLLDPANASAVAPPILAGRLLVNVWEMISQNPEQIARDVDWLTPAGGKGPVPAGAYHWGMHPLVVDPTATVEPGTAFDTSKGPIWIDRNAHVRAFTRLAGPAYIGFGATVLGGAIEAVSIGPICRVRGELAESVCLGYVNKQHDGHIGHAYLGRWVNLGAETTNSDLKNNYGTISIWTPEGEKDTGEIKMGSLIGDHVKTGIGLLLNTGTVIGAGCNLYGTQMPPTFVPPFSWGTGDQLVEYRLDRFLECAEIAMSRRGLEMSDSHRLQLERAWRRGRQQAAEVASKSSR
jgi:UDP-N-acetylglucosamine diphosphorylase/glucosamine-1-phosphate N-acetyltransferase